MSSTSGSREWQFFLGTREAEFNPLQVGEFPGPFMAQVGGIIRQE